MRRRLKASLLWGCIGGLSFLVLLQGYRLVVGLPAVSLLASLSVAAGVAAVTVAAAYALEGRL